MIEQPEGVPENNESAQSDGQPQEEKTTKHGVARAVMFAVGLFVIACAIGVFLYLVGI